MSRYSPTSQTTVGLADVLNPTEDNRDSAYFSCSSNGEASKHTSIVSMNNSHVFTSPSSGYQSSGTDKTPSPVVPNTIGPLSSPATSSMTVASMVSPTTPSSVDATMLAKLDRPSYEPSQRGSGISANGEPQRRGSVDGRLGIGFEGMKLAGNSPYSSQNQSTTSIQSSLQQQRNPNAGDRLSAQRPSNTYQPHSARYGADMPKHSRTAPTITGPATSAVANAAEPTKGQPWAFPDEILPRTNGDASRQASYIGSRRSSNADSLASSQYTTESRLPQGQRRLEDGYPVDPQRLSRASSEFQGASHHHHTLQHRQIGDVRDEDAGSPGSGQPYSRTPELRISHKLAERKRRNEMKELYDELRDLMPQERGSKASKWEILSKAISEHKRQDEMIRHLSEHWRRTQAELQVSRDETTELRMELQQLRQELNNHISQMNLAGHASQPQTPLEAYPSDPYNRGIPPPPRPDARAELPPLRSIGGPMPACPEGMTGVQYHQEQRAVNGYPQGYPQRV